MASLTSLLKALRIPKERMHFQRRLYHQEESLSTSCVLVCDAAHVLFTQKSSLRTSSAAHSL